MFGLGQNQAERRSTRERISEDRKALREVVVTAILFGLTLNLVSDFLYDLPEAFLHPWRIFLAVFASLATLYFYRSLIKQYFTSYSRRSASFTAAIVWDSKTGEFVYLQPIYQPQLLAHFQLRKMKSKELEKIKKTLIIPDLKIENVDRSPLLSLFESVLLYKLRSGSYFKHSRPHIVHLIKNPQQGKAEYDISYLTADIPGEYKTTELKRSADKSSFILEWTEEYHGRIEIGIQCKVAQTTYRLPFGIKSLDDGYDFVDLQSLNPMIEFDGIPDNREPSRFVMALYEVTLSGEFSPERLGVGISKVDNLVEWCESFFDSLSLEFGWYKHLGLLNYQKMIQEQMKHGLYRNEQGFPPRY